MVAKVATKPEFLFAKKKMLVTLVTISLNFEPCTKSCHDHSLGVIVVVIVV